MNNQEIETCLNPCMVWCKTSLLENQKRNQRGEIANLEEKDCHAR
jgi:hypothetical protein